MLLSYSVVVPHVLLLYLLVINMAEPTFNRDPQQSLFSQSSQEKEISQENGTIQHFTSNRGKPKVSIGGYSYTLNKEGNGRMYWRCENRLCKGTVIISNDWLISSREHQHAPDPTKVKVLF